jgi:hypothetical protein
VFRLLPLLDDLPEVTDCILDDVLQEQDPLVKKGGLRGICTFELADPGILIKHILAWFRTLPNKKNLQ